MEEELKELEKALNEAKDNFIELNDSYNGLLAQEHEEKNKNSYYRSEKEENKEEDFDVNLVFGVILALTFFSSVPNLVILILSIATGIYAFIKIRNKYKNKDTKKVDDKEKLYKDALYEKLVKARSLYNALKNEYERKKYNFEWQEKGNVNRTLGIQDNQESQLYQIYSEYIDYVKNTSLSEKIDNKNKVYGFNPENK